MDIPSVLFFFSFHFFRTLVARDVRSLSAAITRILIQSVMRWCSLIEIQNERFAYSFLSLSLSLSLSLPLLITFREHLSLSLSFVLSFSLALYIYIWMKNENITFSLSLSLSLSLALSLIRAFIIQYNSMYKRFSRIILQNIALHPNKNIFIYIICSDTTIVGHTNKTACTFTKS